MTTLIKLVNKKQTFRRFRCKCGNCGTRMWVDNKSDIDNRVDGLELVRCVKCGREVIVNSDDKLLNNILVITGVTVLIILGAAFLPRSETVSTILMIAGKTSLWRNMSMICTICLSILFQPGRLDLRIRSKFCR